MPALLPGAIQASNASQNSTRCSSQRKFVFAEFFAGMGGLSSTMNCLAGGTVSVCATLDDYDGWDILRDSDFEIGMQICEEVDHAHFAPPCKTLTRSRRTDEHGTVPVLRSDTNPEGWGNRQTEDANRIVSRMVMMILRLITRRRTFSVENPWTSFLWLLKVMQKVIKKTDVSLVLLHQCCYGAVTPKPTGILTNASWMKTVNGLCWEQRKHYHLKGGLVGKAWDYVTDQWVWRTSLAAEYPCGLTVAWTRSLLVWLENDAGKLWVNERIHTLVGKWRNTLTLSTNVKEIDNPNSETAMEKRERENHECVGGLRNPRTAVKKSSKLRSTGNRIRTVIDLWMTDEVIGGLDSNIQAGLSNQQVLQLRHSLATEFQCSVTEEGLQENLWKTMLLEAEDPDAMVLHRWMCEGFPLGIQADIDHTGVFPYVAEDTAAVEASRTGGVFMQDLDGSHVNYKSFSEAGEKAQAQLDKLLDQGRAKLYHSWEEVMKDLGHKAQLTKVACLVKTKEDGSEKVRLIIDSRRSGTNGRMTIRERVVLPRITDVAASLQRLLVCNNGYRAWPSLMSADFSDAFHMMKLRNDEKQFVIVKGADLDGQPRYYGMQAVTFGLAPGPLLWGRLASAAMRLSQSVAYQHEAEVQCFVDDPLIISMASTNWHHTRICVRYLALWRALGLEVAWHKVDRGAQLQWIGFELALCGPGNKDLVVRLSEPKRLKLTQVFDEISECKGVVPMQLLQYSAGVLGWLSSAVPVTRPWMAMIWAAITQKRDPTRTNTRRRKGLIFVKQVENAIRWLRVLTEYKHGTFSLSKTFRWRPEAPTMMVQTDASPFGLGGILYQGGHIVAFYHDELHDEDFVRFCSTKGDPAFQSEYELLAVFVALKVFEQWITYRHQVTRIMIRSDNMAVVSAAFLYKSSSPIMVQLTAEVVLQLEYMEVAHVVSQHVPGALNLIADKLSRPELTFPLPKALEHSVCVTVPKRTDDFYRAWPSQCKTCLQAIFLNRACSVQPFCRDWVFKVTPFRIFLPIQDCQATRQVAGIGLGIETLRLVSCLSPFQFDVISFETFSVDVNSLRPFQFDVNSLRLVSCLPPFQLDVISFETLFSLT